MRFHQLGIGQNFRLEDETYTKLDTLMAAHAGSGQRRLIKRSAEVTPCQNETGITASVPARDELPAATVLAAFDAFYGQCRELLGDCGNDARRREALEAELEQARRTFFQQLEKGVS